MENKSRDIYFIRITCIRSDHMAGNRNLKTYMPEFLGCVVTNGDFINGSALNHVVKIVEGLIYIFMTTISVCRHRT